MSVSRPSFKEFVAKVGVRLGAMVLGVGSIVSLIFIGDYFNLGFLQSQGGIIVSALLLMEAFFFTVILLAVLMGKI